MKRFDIPNGNRNCVNGLLLWAHKLSVRFLLMLFFICFLFSAIAMPTNVDIVHLYFVSHYLNGLVDVSIALGGLITKYSGSNGASKWLCFLHGESQQNSNSKNSS